MDIQRFLVYGLVVLLIIVALARARRSHSLTARDVKGNVAIGDQSGTLNQTYSETAAPPSGAGHDSAPPHGDRVAWAIGIIAILIAAAQLTHDIYK
jgi:hypothetical protein